MSLTAAEINQEIRDRLNRGDEIGESRVYAWMNRVKRRTQASGSPMDFMYHEILALSGSGSGRPGLETKFNPNLLALPPNFLALLWLKVYTGDTVSMTDAARIFGLTVVPKLYYFPSTCTSGDGASTDHVAGQQDLYPLFANDDSFIASEFTARGLTDFDVDIFLATSEDARILSRETSPLVPASVSDPEAPLVVVGGDIYNEHPQRLLVTTSMSEAGYASGPWSAKFLTIVNYADLYTDGDFRLLHLGMYRALPDYNAPSFETKSAPLVIEDIFTRTGEDVLVYGTLELAWEYLDDESRSSGYAQKRGNAERDFRRSHLIPQAMGKIDTPRRIKEGTRVVGAY